MKVLMINGSPREGSNTLLALKAMEAIFESNGIDTEIVNIGKMDIKGCQACNYCEKNGCCVIDDIVNEVAKKLEEADGFVIGSPVYYASANATVIALLDRLFFSSSFDKTMKVGASVVTARRGGCSSTFDMLNKYFTNSGMTVASSTYWNSVHGLKPGEAVADEEGIATVKNLAHNMTFLIKAIALGKEKYGMPVKESPAVTNFIR